MFKSHYLLVLAICMAFSACKRTIEDNNNNNNTGESQKYEPKGHMSHDYRNPSEMIHKSVHYIVALAIFLLFIACFLKLARCVLCGVPRTVIRLISSVLFIMSLASIVASFALYWTTFELKWLIQVLPMMVGLALICGRIVFK
ncbi:hypothetical protein J8273_1166 [Carpediemonas membranifera]|uniref:Uncharacterized protein n=1 Tax=Carpediemonas membranifera TaxID=201153 RepID=A0A8J6C158_9EUKA|nr:hypothetical protein J8273_1166 [Carpediemonas membranifera]|eukprot:KAG9397251.1 hypothetical protein J8273_1166 [Carpediemonas membranifera]